YLTKRVCPKLKWQTGQLNFAQAGLLNFRFILTGLEDAFKPCVPLESLKQYRDKRNEYNQRFDQHRVSVAINELGESTAITSAAENVQLSSRLNQLELQLRSELTDALIELAQESQSPLCFFVDGYERLIESNLEAADWFLGDILPK